MYIVGDKTILYLIFNRINGFVGMSTGKAEQLVWTRTSNGANKKLVLHVQPGCGSISITKPVSHLAYEFDVQSKLHRKVSLAAVHQILCRSWGYERLQKSKGSLKACFEQGKFKKNVTKVWHWGSKINIMSELSFLYHKFPFILNFDKF